MPEKLPLIFDIESYLEQVFKEKEKEFASFSHPNGDGRDLETWLDYRLNHLVLIRYAIGKTFSLPLMKANYEGYLPKAKLAEANVRFEKLFNQRIQDSFEVYRSAGGKYPTYEQFLTEYRHKKPE